MRNKKESVALSQSDKDNLRKGVLVLRAVNHPFRQRIISELSKETMNVTDLYIKLRSEQSVASQHLAILRRAGVVIDNRVGKFIYYSIDLVRLDKIVSITSKLADLTN